MLKDQASRKRALTPTESFIVQAPAGSGKTSLLIQRILTLLTIANKPEEILAITFTKKAANEMRVRVISALQSATNAVEPETDNEKQTWQLAKAVIKRDKQLNWQLIDNPNQLKIQTIDALCTYLTKQLPLLSQFGAQPNITDDASVLYEEAIQEVLTYVESSMPWAEDIKNLLTHLDNDINKLQQLLVNLLAKRDQWLPYIHLDECEENIKDYLESNLQQIISRQLKHTISFFPTELLSEMRTLIAYALCKSESTLNTISDWLSVKQLLITEDGSWRKQLTARNGFPAPSKAGNPADKLRFKHYKERALTLIKQIEDNEPLKTQLNELAYLPTATYQKAQWEVLKSLLQVLAIATAQLRVIFKNHGKIDFIENTQATLTSLGESESPTDLALRLDYQIKHILIDEFQDTSLTQHQLLNKLIAGWEENDGRTLFIVGDPMQSIYRFREAEVGLFLRIYEHGMGQIKLTPLQLSTNFRSTPNIVNWNNKHFSTIFPKVNNPTTGAVRYHASESGQNKSASIVGIHSFNEKDSAGQTNQVITLIKNAKSSSAHESIAILVRSRQHLINIIPALKSANIPYQAIEIDSLASRQIIQDVYSLMSALYHPANRIAWLAVLRAPWCGLSLADLLTIAGNEPNETILSQLNQESVTSKLSSDGQRRLNIISPILAYSLAQRDRLDTRTWIEKTWHSLGGPATLTDRKDLDDINSFFNLISKISASEECFDLDKLNHQLKKLYASPTNDADAVKLMTIHSAKGLEFDTVILPHLERKSATDTNPLLLLGQLPLILAPIHATGDDNEPIYRYLRRKESEKARHELDRLLYVATTRAKKNLHLLYNTTEKSASGSFLKSLSPLLNQQTISESIKTTHDIPTQHKNCLYRLNASWHNPYTQQAIKLSQSHQSPPGFQLVDTAPKIVGTVAHLILQQISIKGINWWQSTNSTQKNYYTSQLLKQNSMPATMLAENQKKLTTLIDNVVNDNRGAWILAAHTEAKSEYAITAIINNEAKSLVIDRTFIDKDDIRWIIDYKTTNSSRNTDQYKSKMNEYAMALQHHETRKIKLGLYFAMSLAWEEWHAF